MEETIEAMKWPVGYPFASIWIVRKHPKGVSPIHEVKGAISVSEVAVQRALTEARQKLYDRNSKDELSETKMET